MFCWNMIFFELGERAMGDISIADLIKTAHDLSEALMDAPGRQISQYKIKELQEVIRAVGASVTAVLETQSKLVEKVRQLQKQNHDLEDWHTVTNRYALVEASPGVFIYALKQDAVGPEPKHFICPDCYQRHTKSILQYSAITSSGLKKYRCHICQTNILVRAIL